MKRQNRIAHAILLLLLALIVVLIVTNKDEQASTKSVPASLTELSGKTVGVQSGTLYEEGLLAKCPDAIVEFYSDFNTMILAVEQGKLDAYLTETSAFAVESKNHPGMRMIDDPCDTLYVGPAVAKDNYALYDKLSQFITLFHEDGTQEQMWSYWMDNYDPDSCAVDTSGLTGENGELTIAVEGGYEPFSYVKDGELQGYDVDFFTRFCRCYGYTPNFVTLTYESIAPALQSGKVDAGISLLSDERAEELLIAGSHYSYQLIAAVYVGDTTQKGFFESVMDSIEKTFIRESRWKMFAEGAGITVLISVCAVLIGTVLGFLFYLVMYNTDSKIVHGCINFLSGLLHITPAVVLLMVMYYIIFGKTDINAIPVAILCFGCIFGSSMLAMIESGVRAVGRGQMEAARAQGFTHNSAFLRIVFPQAANHFLPTYKDEVIALIKETSIVGYIAITDLTKMSDLIRGRTFEPFFPLIATTIIYAVISLLLVMLVEKINISIDPHKRRQDKILKGIDTTKVSEDSKTDSSRYITLK